MLCGRPSGLMDWVPVTYMGDPQSQESYISKSTASFVQEEQRANEVKEGWTERVQTNTATQCFCS